MRTYTVIWDFDGTLLSNDPHDSKQSLMLFKVEEAGANMPFSKRVVAHIMIYADRKEHLRRMFKRFYVSFMKGTHVTAIDRVSERLAAKISTADRQAVMELKRQGYTIAVGDGYTDIPMLDWARDAIVMDRSGRKEKQFRNKKYRFISSIPEIMELIPEF